ncbi:MAG: hypothetical protein U9R68_07715 [Planctomycetota bacterium]|nr:hypothetical protein [Planctomycetota bacterium]
MSLCKTADIKSRLGETGSEYDAVIDQIRTGFDAFADRFTRRVLSQTDSDVTEYYTGGCDTLQLVRYPVIAVTSIKESFTYDFDSATALTADSDYRLIGGGVKGLLLRLYCDWPDQPDGVQIVYRGGFAEPDAELGDGETALPDDLREAAIEQCSFIFKRKDDIGLSGVGFDGGSFNKFSAIKLLPTVKAVLESYRRISL